MARGLAAFIIDKWIPQGTVPLAGDDTVEEHRGKKVYGKERHRDAVRSTHSYTTYRWGHKWVVLTVLVRFPFAARPWALPVLVALYRSPEWNKKHCRQHKTPAELMRQLLAVISPPIRWQVSCTDIAGGWQWSVCFTPTPICTLSRRWFVEEKWGDREKREPSSLRRPR